MASFDLFLPLLLRFEGGYADDLTDPGGETNKGVTMATFRQCSHELLGIEPTSDNLKALTDGQAGIVYRTLYWNKMGGDSIQSQDLANMVCDFYVNAGTNATAMLQRILNSMGAQVIQDGAIGPASIQALNALNQIEVYRLYKHSRIHYYQTLSQRFPQFLQGWLNRVDAFPNL